MNDVESAPFLWPHFVLITSAPGQNLNSTFRLWELSPQDRTDLLAELTARLTISATRDIGHIHRFLTQPVINASGKPVGKLGNSLARASLSALAFVCVDLGRLPTGKFINADLIKELISWVRSY